jgi:hypothetical protein
LCFVADSALWHEAHAPAAGTVAPCVSWQLAHVAWPLGALADSRAWHEAHAAPARGA